MNICIQKTLIDISYISEIEIIDDRVFLATIL